MQSVSILLVTNSYLPIMGGSEIEAQRVSQALIGRGHKVQILCPGGSPMPSMSSWTDECGIPVRAFGNKAPKRLRGHIFAWRVAWAILGKFRGYDLVYFLMPGLQVALGALVARFLRKPFIMKFSGSNEIRRLDNSSVGRMQLRVLEKWAGVIMILNPGMTEEAAECGLSASKLLLMPNPVDLKEFCPVSAEKRAALRARHGIPVDAEVVLFVGRLAPEKELLSLVTGFGKVAAVRERAMLVLVGDGPCRRELEKMAADELSDRIRFAGAVSPSAVHEWHQMADVFTLVSSLEGLPVSLIEAMATGVPAVVSGIPANRQLVDSGVEGVVIETGDSAALGRALTEMLGNPEMLRCMGRAARTRIGESCSTTRVTDLYEQVFEKLLSGDRGSE